MIQVIGRKKCKATQKAIRFFRERSIAIQSLDLADHPFGGRELDNCALAAGGLDKLIDTASPAYRDRGLAHMDFDPREELLDNTGLLLTPLVRQGKSIAIGDDEAAWKTMAAREKT
jgi:arsenate reductase-like glutaredoxin family protein